MEYCLSMTLERDKKIIPDLNIYNFALKYDIFRKIIIHYYYKNIIKSMTIIYVDLKGIKSIISELKEEDCSEFYPYLKKIKYRVLRLNTVIEKSQDVKFEGIKNMYKDIYKLINDIEIISKKRLNNTFEHFKTDKNLLSEISKKGQIALSNASL